jgi:hypothetical protein
VVPFDDHVVDLSASPDRLTCLLTFTPGDPRAPEPDPQEILARAGALGFDASALLPAREIAAMLHDAAAARTPIRGRSLSPARESVARVIVSKTPRAVLNLRKVAAPPPHPAGHGRHRRAGARVQRGDRPPRPEGILRRP